MRNKAARRQYLRLPDHWIREGLRTGWQLLGRHWASAIFLAFLPPIVVAAVPDAAGSVAAVSAVLAFVAFAPGSSKGKESYLSGLTMWFATLVGFGFLAIHHIWGWHSMIGSYGAALFACGALMVFQPTGRVRRSSAWAFAPFDVALMLAGGSPDARAARWARRRYVAHAPRIWAFGGVLATITMLIPLLLPVCVALSWGLLCAVYRLESPGDEIASLTGSAA